MLHIHAYSSDPVCSRVSHVGGPAGILLYLLDIAFRLAQQVQPVVVSNVSACKSATLATLHFNADPHTPIKPIQVWWFHKYSLTASVGVTTQHMGVYSRPWSVPGARMQGIFRYIPLCMQF